MSVGLGGRAVGVKFHRLKVTTCEGHPMVCLPDEYCCNYCEMDKMLLGKHHSNASPPAPMVGL